MATRTRIPTLLAVTGVTGALFAGTAASAGSAAPAPRVAADRTITLDATTMSADAMLAAMPDARLDPPQARIRVAIANLAKSQIGKREVPSQCGGRANCYPKAYKTNKYVVRPDEWCGVFVNWAWTKGGADKRPSMKGSGLKQGHYATYWQKWGKSVKRWRTQADIGDAIVYGSYPSSAHIGVVVGVKYSKTTGKITYVRTVEGNVGDKVTDKGWRKVGSLYGRGFKASGYVAPVPGA
jgi:hypothetical protein